jgi:hypothetical protein
LESCFLMRFRATVLRDRVESDPECPLWCGDEAALQPKRAARDRRGLSSESPPTSFRLNPYRLRLAE